MPGSMKLLGTDSTFTRATLSAAPQSGPLSGLYRPELRAGFPDWRGVVARAVEPIRGIEKSVKQTLARSTRSRCFFGVGRPSPHGIQDRPS